jgi:hypothetical protein
MQTLLGFRKIERMPRLRGELRLRKMQILLWLQFFKQLREMQRVSLLY